MGKKTSYFAWDTTVSSSLCVRASNESNNRAEFTNQGLGGRADKDRRSALPDSDVQECSVAVEVLWPKAWRGKYSKLRIIYASAKEIMASPLSALLALLKSSESSSAEFTSLALMTSTTGQPTRTPSNALPA